MEDSKKENKTKNNPKQEPAAAQASQSCWKLTVTIYEQTKI